MGYSQFQEDLEIVQHVPATGNLLDLGAWHPTEFSNSRLLIERGWTATLVEPSPEPFWTLFKEYGKNPNVRLICAAIGMDRAFAKMHVTADAVSTLDLATFEKWKEAGGYYGEMWVPVFTLAEFFNQFGGDWHFVNIDVEGYSCDVFRALLDSGNRPACICVEHDGRDVEITQWARGAGYRQVLMNGTNVVFAL